MWRNIVKAIIGIGIVILVLLYISAGYVEASSGLDLDFETGAVFSEYNDIRIPNKTGTDISFSEELKTDSTYFIRGQMNYSINDRHNFALLAAPLRLEATGKTNKPVFFEGIEFPANTWLKGKYRFDSYRFTYRYDFRPAERLTLGLGLTAKIRAAAISIEDAMQKSEKLNTGFVPLLSFRAEWMFLNRWSLLLAGDALAAPQGRAEDILISMRFRITKDISLKMGYRILEGGADAESVYNFTLIHYIVLGSRVSF